MPTYLISNRPPTDYRPSPEAAAAWNEWFDSLGPHLVDRGNPTFAPEALGAPAGETTLGGYTLVDADDLDHALALAAGCPVLRAGGGVEVGELALLNRGTTAVAGEADGHGPHHVVVHDLETGYALPTPP